MTLSSLQNLYRQQSDTTQTVALMAESGDKDALEMLEPMRVADQALHSRLKSRLSVALQKVQEGTN